ncbi:hypothetical protein CC86DRAFT_340187 [Ophiobolus disseminans]|uniref:Uncharacterized protein n=1 Tax=Ophiobolus disseminans TaxID=1469910 RepID=A0A6A7AH20_9PLEO|nr:hypothetical protein CC86DRAFT_340187 [Ophiobolus disseminans]
MMAVLEAILPVVSRSSSLALELYRVAASSHDEAAKDLIQAAGATNNFASVLKQIGTIVKEDDRLPSHEAIETLEEVIEQSRSISAELESLAALADEEQHHRNGDAHYDSHERSRQDQPPTTRLVYLATHLEALRVTLSVLLQTLYTAQSIIWSKFRPTISPQQTAKAVANERLQLESLITEQQMSILSAISIYELVPIGNSRLLMEADSSQSLVAAGDMPSPGNLLRFQDRYIGSLDMTSSTTPKRLVSVRNVTSSQAERLLDRWTCLPQVKSDLEETERRSRTQQRESRQPMVESDDEEEQCQRQKLAGSGTRMSAPPQRSGGVQPLFMDANTLPIPVRETRYGPTAPLSPAASPGTSRNSLPVPSNEQDSPVSPRSSISSLPVEAAAAVEAKEEDEDLDLEIPWQLCTRKYYWKYVDGKIVGSNTEQLPSVAFLERNSWTEIMASWVCKEAIREAGYRFTQVQKDVKDGRRTKFETCFCIEKPLQFERVKNLVERTVEIYRQRKPPSPPPQVRRSSFNRLPQQFGRASEIDRDRTPVPSKTHPPLGRTTSSVPIPPMVPPPLDRSLSMPGPGFQHGPNPHPSALQIPMPPQGPYSTSVPQSPYSPHMPPGPYPQQLYNSPQAMYPPNPTFGIPALPPHLQPYNVNVQQSPLRQLYPVPTARSKYDDEYSTTDSDSAKERRRRRSRSRSRYAAESKKKSHNKSKAAGVLMGVGGLTALLDGLSGL